MSERNLYVAQKGNAVEWTIPVRDLEPTQVRVKVHSVGINPIDWKTIDNNLADGAGQGNEFAGVVSEVGSEVKSIKVGDTVAGGVGGGDIDNKENGAFTELLTIEEHLVFKFPYKLTEASSDDIPTGIPKTFEQAASLGLVADTAAVAFDGREKPGPEDYALIYGVTGALGFISAQYARNLGYKVIGVSAPLPEITNELEGIEWLDRHDPEWPEKAKKIANNRIVFAYDTICIDALDQVFSTASTEVPSVAAYSLPDQTPSEKVVESNPKARVEHPLYFLLMQEVKKFGTMALPNETKPHERAPQLVGHINAQLAKNEIKALHVKVLNGLDKINDALDVNRKGVRGTKVVVKL